jgi:hypothetical protein
VLKREARCRKLATFVKAIKAGGEHGIPSGHVFAAVCGVLSLSQYEAVIVALRCVRRGSCHLLYFVQDLRLRLNLSLRRSSSRSAGYYRPRMVTL